MLVDWIQQLPAPFSYINIRRRAVNTVTRFGEQFTQTVGMNE